MTGDGCTLTKPRSARPAVSLVEVAVCVAIVGVMMVAALTTVSSVGLTRRIDGDRQIGRMLAEQLMAEILSKDYEEPDVAPGSFGTDSNEVTAGNRSLYDDVDDYDGWSASPPEMPDGTAVPERNGWGRSVAVVYVSPVDFESVQGTDAGVKRITVSVTRNGDEITSLVALRGRTRALE